MRYADCSFCGREMDIAEAPERGQLLACPSCSDMLRREDYGGSSLYESRADDTTIRYYAAVAARAIAHNEDIRARLRRAGVGGRAS